MELKLAKETDFKKLTDFYKYVISNTQNMEKCCRWNYGLHPTDEMIKSYITENAIYYIEENEEILGAASITLTQDENYHTVKWSLNLKDDEVAVIHILCVNPKKQKCGFAKKIMELVIDFARKQNKKAIRLDAINCNTPAHKLYESLGFKKCDVKNWYASNLGNIDFFLYEYNF